MRQRNKRSNELQSLFDLFDKKLMELDSIDFSDEMFMELVALELLRRCNYGIYGLLDEAKRAFIDTLADDHRTLQQSVIRTLLGLLEMYASLTHQEDGRINPDRVDGRNEAAAEACEQIRKLDLRLPLV
jgi:hypothetical protein